MCIFTLITWLSKVKGAKKLGKCSDDLEKPLPAESELRNSLNVGCWYCCCPSVPGRSQQRYFHDDLASKGSQIVNGGHLTDTYNFQRWCTNKDFRSYCGRWATPLTKLARLATQRTKALSTGESKWCKASKRKQLGFLQMQGTSMPVW